jgi:predicted nuclease with RNAse H fold
MKYVGIDLAGNPKNPTGICLLSIDPEENKTVSTKLLYSDSQLMTETRKSEPDLVAIDAPLTYSGINRKCDLDLHEYGALPVTLRGMEVLARRGTALCQEMGDAGLKTIEVFSAASAKILGLYDKDDGLAQKKLMEAGITGDLDRRMLSRDELDSIYCALTAYLSTKSATESVGDEEGSIVIPKV